MSMQVLKLINCLIFSIYNVAVLYSMGYNNEFDNLNFKKWSFLIAISCVFIYIENFLVFPFIKIIITFINLLILCQFMYKISFVKKLLRCLISISIFTFSDIIASFVFIVLLKINILSVMKNPVYYILYNLLSFIILTMIMPLIKLKKIKLFTSSNINKRTQILIFLIIILQIIRICIEFFINYFISTIPHLQYISIASYICSVSSIMLLLYSANSIIDKENIINLSKDYNEKLKVYNDVLQASIENQSKIAHEHGNQLTVLSGYITNNELEKARQYLTKIIGQTNVSSNKLFDQIKENGLKALLLFKLAVIEKKNIELETVIDEYIYDTIIPSEDMCNIIAIFLDNAIDATILSDEPYISLSIIKKDFGLLISVMNSISNSDIDINKIFKKGFSSKGEGRGFGLFIVDEIVKKYEELELKTYVENMLFIQELRILNNVTSTTFSTTVLEA